MLYKQPTSKYVPYSLYSKTNRPMHYRQISVERQAVKDLMNDSADIHPVNKLWIPGDKLLG